jgi:hypothetical protein
MSAAGTPSPPPPSEQEAGETIPEKVKDEAPSPAEKVTGAAQPPPSTKGQVLLVIFEAFVYIIVAVLVVIAIYVNIGIWKGWYSNPTLTLFSADSNFILAAGAIGVIAFEIRKERHGK